MRICSCQSSTGATRGSRLVIANDPDADRLAVAEHNPAVPGGWQTFSGNEIGVLLTHWVWTNFKKQHPEVSAGLLDYSSQSFTMLVVLQYIQVDITLQC